MTTKAQLEALAEAVASQLADEVKTLIDPITARLVVLAGRVDGLDALTARVNALEARAAAAGIGQERRFVRYDTDPADPARSRLFLDDGSFIIVPAESEDRTFPAVVGRA